MVFAAGILLLMQIMGAGTGGRMSPFDAKVTCIVKEHKWEQAIRRFLSAPVIMTRMVDDTQAVFCAEDGYGHWGFLIALGSVCALHGE